MDNILQSLFPKLWAAHQEAKKRKQKQACIAMTAVLANLPDPCLVCCNQYCPCNPRESLQQSK